MTRLYHTFSLLTVCTLTCFNLLGQTASFLLLKPQGVDPTFVAPEWYINGTRIVATDKYFKINIHYPKFDTVIVVRNSTGDKRIIITRFDGNHKYKLFPPGCCHDLGIDDEKNLKEYAKRCSFDEKKINESQKDKIYSLCDSLRRINETGKVIFTLTNGSNLDSLVGTFGLADGKFTKGVFLQNNKSVVSDDPLYSESSGDSHFIKIATVAMRDFESYNAEKDNISLISNDDKKVFVFKNELVSFSYRFFNRETLSVVYDKLTNQTKLELIK